MQPFSSFLLGAALFISVQAWPAERWSAVISPDNSLEFSFVKDQAPVGRLGLGGWGPNWQWVGLSPRPRSPWRETPHRCAIRG